MSRGENLELGRDILIKGIITFGCIKRQPHFSSTFSTLSIMSSHSLSFLLRNQSPEGNQRRERGEKWGLKRKIGEVRILREHHEHNIGKMKVPLRNLFISS